MHLHPFASFCLKEIPDDRDSTTALQVRPDFFTFPFNIMFLSIPSLPPSLLANVPLSLSPSPLFLVDSLPPVWCGML